MVSINTNLSAIIAQQNMAKATNRLNIAFERLTSGYKINHASDDAANYSVANSMSVKISSWDVACENVNLGNDMAETAQGALSIMQEHATKIHNLITQAQNGTYDQQSLNAINTEVQSRIDEIDRLYNMTEYNGLYLFHDNATMASGGSSSSATDFIESITSVSVDPNAVVSSTNTVEDIINAGYTTIGIQDAAGMADFADYVSGTGIYSSAHDCQGLTFVMMNDIDMDDYIQNNMGGSWVPIGIEPVSASSILVHSFSGTFDGQGNILNGMSINNNTAFPTTGGLFASIVGAA